MELRIPWEVDIMETVSSDEEEILRKPCYGRTEKKKKKEKMKAERNPKGSLEDGIR